MNRSKIIHLDMDSYFATMEQQAYPNLRGKPLGVAGKGKGERTVVTGASIEAKKFGIRSGMSSWEALRLCPHLILIPASYDRYAFSSRRIFALLERFSPRVDVFSIDEAFIDLGEDISWQDGVTVAKRIKELIRINIGSWVTCSIGLSYGRTLAKLASEMDKPNGLTLLRPEDFEDIARITPVEELCGIGYRFKSRLNRLGVSTVEDMGKIPKEMLIQVFGDFVGTWMNNIGNGVDNSLIRSFRALPREKSVGHSYTLPRDVRLLSDAKKVLLLLSERVGVRLRRKGLIGKSISVYLRFEDRSGWGQSQIQKEYIDDGHQVYKAAERLLRNLNTNHRPIRLVAVTIGNLVARTESTQQLFDADKKYEHLTKSLDSLNERYGEFTVFRATLSTIRRKVLNLPDGRNHRQFIPKISEVNPFTKRL